MRRAALQHNDPATFSLLIRKAPHMLVAKTSTGNTALDVLELLNPDRSNHAELLSLTHACTAAYKRSKIFSLTRHCGISTPLADLLKPHVAIWLSLLRHRADPIIVVSPSTTRVVQMLSRLYNHERGVLRDIMEYVVPNAASLEDEDWQLDELTKLTRSLATKNETLAAKDEVLAAKGEMPASPRSRRTMPPSSPASPLARSKKIVSKGTLNLQLLVVQRANPLNHIINTSPPLPPRREWRAPALLVLQAHAGNAPRSPRRLRPYRAHYVSTRDSQRIGGACFRKLSFRKLIVHSEILGDLRHRLVGNRHIIHH